MRAQFAGWGLSVIVAVTSVNSAFGRYLTGLLGQPAAWASRVFGRRLSQ